jgi:hypothetical protein
MDVSENSVREFVNDEFIQKIIKRFQEMYVDIGDLY